MLKVNIDSNGIVTRADNNEVIATILGFGHTDFFKNPNMVKNYNFKLNNGKHVKLYHGGFVETKKDDETTEKNFVESCHARCPKNVRHCFMYGKNNCPYGKLEDVGFYIF